MAAPKAYVIGGHGFEGDRFFPVPEGCTIVVKALSGGITKYGATKLYNKLLCTMPEANLLYPSKHTSALIKSFGSVAIYTAGELCPNFIYSLLDCPDEIDADTFCDGYGSGIIDLQEKRGSEDCEASAETISYVTDWPTKELSQRITDMFAYSVYPTKESIKANMDTVVPEKTSLEEVLQAKATVSISQEELCSLFPGVYYNFVCRSLAYAKIGMNRNRINEAERKRKGLLKNYYTSNAYKQPVNLRSHYVLHPVETGQSIFDAIRSEDEDTILRDYIYRLSSSKTTVDRKRAILNYRVPGAVVDYTGNLLANQGEGSILWFAIRNNKPKLIEPLVQLGARVDYLVLGKSLIEIADEVSPEMGRVIRNATKDKCFLYAAEESGLSCYGAKPPPGKQCCRTCEDVKAAYARMMGPGVLGILKATLGSKGWALDSSKIRQCVNPKGPNARWNKPWPPNTRRANRGGSKKRTSRTKR
jgi:hypothetical protein